MSKFSGKCDLYDEIAICGGFEEFKKRNYTIYIGEHKRPLKYDSLKDLVPYYPYIIGSSCYSNESGGTIRLSSRSWVDIEEEDRLKLYLKSLIRIYNRCKRKKIEFDVDDAVKEVSWGNNEDVIREIAARVKDQGNRASIEGLHISMYDYYREMLRKEIEEYCNVTFYNKLVRDKIPSVIEKEGKEVSFKVLSDEEYKNLLYKKLQEEVNEFIKDKNEEEIADVLEVIECIANAEKFDVNRVKKIKEDKRKNKGSFSGRIFLEKVTER